MCLPSSFEKNVPKSELLIFSSKAKWNLLSVLNTHTRLQKKWLNFVVFGKNRKNKLKFGLIT